MKTHEIEAATRTRLQELEPRLRALLPANLYAEVWVDPVVDNLEEAFNHLRTLQRIVIDYVPRDVVVEPPTPGHLRHQWTEGTLMFTDLAGFTPLLEAHANRGQEGVQQLYEIINGYFSTVIEIVSKSGGNLLEFTGDAMLAQFPPNRRSTDTEQAVRAGLRIQRAMRQFANIETEAGTFSLGMRLGLHHGRFLTADLGTPSRMEHILLGKAVQLTKLAEGAGVGGRVNLTVEAYNRVKDFFRFEEGKEPGYMLAVDDFSEEDLGTYEINISSRKMGGGVLFDRSPEALLREIEEILDKVEPIACFIPKAILQVLIESASDRRIPADTPSPTVLFINLLGLPEAIDAANEEEQDELVETFSLAFARINAAVEARGGVLKKVTYHLAGSDIMVFFGVPNAHTNDCARAMEAARSIREIVSSITPPLVGGRQIELGCQLGLSQGRVFAAEIGELRGRREFNILGDTVNTAARLMSRAVGGRILLTESVKELLGDTFPLDSMGMLPLKGKQERLPIYALAEKPAERRASQLMDLFES